MSGHMPGPWQRVGWKPCGIYTAGDLSTATRIATMDARLEHDDNARLIAAAPELLEALKVILKLHEAHHNEPLHSQARGIIAKAEGRS